MSRDGMNYAPEMTAMTRVVEPGEFVFAASHFDHGHIYGQINGLARAGGVLKAVYEPDAKRLEAVLKDHPRARVVQDFNEILEDDEIHLVTAAAIPNQRGAIGLRVLDAGKDYLTDKSPFTTLDQLAAARARVAATGRKYMVCYSERLGNEAAWHAGHLIREGIIGRVLQVPPEPHRCTRPAPCRMHGIVLRFERQRVSHGHLPSCVASAQANADSTPQARVAHSR